MVLEKTHGSCPHCGAVINNYNARTWLYGSPVVTCTKCGDLYFDGRYHEMAVDGAAPDEFDVKKRLIMLVIGIAAAVIGFALDKFNESMGTYAKSLAPVAMMVLGPVIVLFALGDIIMIKTGAKQKKLDKSLAESKKRLSDKGYAKLLEENGCRVPPEYL